MKAKKHKKNGRQPLQVTKETVKNLWIKSGVKAGQTVMGTAFTCITCSCLMTCK